MEKVFLGWSSEPFPNYVRALESLGATVVRDEPACCDALLLPGGGDIHPRFYGESVDGAKDIDEARDRYEQALFQRFFDAGKPILGICRGMQLINTALGGTLYQHIDGHAKTTSGADGSHAVRTDDPWFGALYGQRFTVNSAHHQAVKRLGRGLRTAARADDGTIEALRHESLPVIAVQWHPERLDNGAVLLRAFLESIKKHKKIS